MTCNVHSPALVHVRVVRSEIIFNTILDVGTEVMSFHHASSTSDLLPGRIFVGITRSESTSISILDIGTEVIHSHHASSTSSLLTRKFFVGSKRERADFNLDFTSSVRWAMSDHTDYMSHKPWHVLLLFLTNSMSIICHIHKLVVNICHIQCPHNLSWSVQLAEWGERGHEEFEPHSRYFSKAYFFFYCRVCRIVHLAFPSSEVFHQIMRWPTIPIIPFLESFLLKVTNWAKLASLVGQWERNWTLRASPLLVYSHHMISLQL